MHLHRLPLGILLFSVAMLGLFSPAKSQELQIETNFGWQEVTEYDFGDVLTYEEGFAKFRVFNDTGTDLNFSVATLFALSGEQTVYRFSPDTSGTGSTSIFRGVLPSASFDEFYVIYSPELDVGSSARMTIDYGGGNGTQDVILTGSSSGPAFFEIYDETEDEWYGPLELDAPGGIARIEDIPVLGKGFLRCRIVNRSPDTFFNPSVQLTTLLGEEDVFRMCGSPTGSCLSDGLVNVLAPGESDEFYIIYEPGETITSEVFVDVTYARPGKPELTIGTEITGNGIGDSSIRIFRTETPLQSGLFLAPTTGGSPANYAFSPPTLNLNDATHDRIFLRVANSGNVPLVINSTPVTGSAFALVNSITGSSVPAGASSELLELRFQPSAAGSYTGSITFDTNDPGDPIVVVNLSGEAVKPPPTGSGAPLIITSVIDASGEESTHYSAYGFAAEVGASATKTLRIRNAGQGAPLIITSFTLPPGFSSPGIPASPIAFGDFVDVPITFTPPAVGTYDPPAVIRSNALTDPRNVPLLGSGLSAPGEESVSVFGEQINGNFNPIDDGATAAQASVTNATDYGQVETWNGSRSLGLRIANYGANDTVIGLPTITGADAADFTVSGPFKVLEPGQQTTTNVDLPFTLPSFYALDFAIVFDPTTAGSKEAVVEIPYGSSTYTFTIIGEAEQSPPPRLTNVRGRKIICGSTGPCFHTEESSFNYEVIADGSTVITPDNATFFPPTPRGGSWTSNYRLGTSFGLQLTQAPEISASGFEFIGLPTSYPALAPFGFQIRFTPNSEHVNEAVIPATVTFHTDDATQPTYTFEIQGRAYDENDYPQVRIERSTETAGDGSDLVRVRVFAKADPRKIYRPQISGDLEFWTSQRSQIPFPNVNAFFGVSWRVGTLDESEVGYILFEEGTNERAFFRLIEPAAE